MSMFLNAYRTILRLGTELFCHYRTFGLSDGLSDCRTDCRTVGRAADSGRQCGSMSPWSYCRNSLSDNCRNDCRTVGLSDRLSEYCRILSDKPVGLSDRGSDGDMVGVLSPTLALAFVAWGGVGPVRQVEYDFIEAGITRSQTFVRPNTQRSHSTLSDRFRVHSHRRHHGLMTCSICTLHTRNHADADSRKK